MINEEQLDKYISICENSGYSISREQALESAIKLISLVKQVYKPMTKDEFEIVQKRRRETGDLPQGIGLG